MWVCYSRLHNHHKNPIVYQTSDMMMQPQDIRSPTEQWPKPHGRDFIHDPNTVVRRDISLRADQCELGRPLGAHNSPRPLASHAIPPTSRRQPEESESASENLSPSHSSELLLSN